MSDDDDDEYDLFKAYARRTDPGTSHDAADSIEDHVARMEGIVSEAIKGQSERGATWDELHRLTGLPKATISPRFKPLREKKKLIEWRLDQAGNKIKRPGDSGRGQIVWFPKP
jgi:hypothetical protein